MRKDKLTYIYNLTTTTIQNIKLNINISMINKQQGYRTSTIIIMSWKSHNANSNPTKQNNNNK
jgi:hypothetical protein